MFMYCTGRPGGREIPVIKFSGLVRKNA